MNYSQAVRKIVSDYRRRISEYEQAELDLMEQNAEFKKCELSLRELKLKKAKGEKINERNLSELEAQNKKIRKSTGIVPPAPNCKVCGDTGRVNGRFCDCAVKLSIASQTGEIGIPLHKFEEVDYSVYGEKADEYRKLFGNIATICSNYPNNKKRCLVISGSTGNGKTYLAGCAVQKVLERGMSVMALTAFSANNRFLKFHTSFDNDKYEYLDPMIDCALLVIDDLGTESILKNVTIEYLYQVINERNTIGKLTLITTNLGHNDILTRYGERIYSRLFDKSLSYAVAIKGKDIRSAL